jgi:hypothetical protein
LNRYLRFRLSGSQNLLLNKFSTLGPEADSQLEPSGKYIITDKGETEAQKY